MTFISHARTVEELRQELLSDLNRRIDNQIAQRKAFARGKESEARFNARINELETMLAFWTNIILVYATPGPGRPPKVPNLKEE